MRPSTSGGSVSGMRNVPIAQRRSASAESSPRSAAIAGTEMSGGEAAHSTSPLASAAGGTASLNAPAISTGVASIVQAMMSASRHGRPR